MRRASLLATLAALAAGAAVPAAAHTLGAHGAGLASGLSHPVGGLDHLLAMVTVGLWAAQHGGRAMVAVPAAFMGSMVLGGALGMAGVGLPGVELAILASVMVLGAVVALKLRLPVGAGMAIVGAFAVFHGHAHGAEMPDAASPALYAVGFLLATGVLHAVGVAAALVAGKALSGAGDKVIRVGGAAIAASGAILMTL